MEKAESALATATAWTAIMIDRQRTNRRNEGIPE